METKRLSAADVYRGLVMLLMMAEVLQFPEISDALPQNKFWQFLAFNQSHVDWVGCSLHDLIQPSFTFLVGLVLPYSLQKRSTQQKGIYVHALRRSVILVLLGIFLRSQHASQTYFTFEDTLSQIGLGYIFLVGMEKLSQGWQLAIFSFILLAYWLAFVLYPLPAPSFDYAAVKVDPTWPALKQGFEAHWNKNSNLAWAFDTWFLNLFPRAKAFTANEGGYATLSFVPTLATMIFGLMVGKLLIGNSSTIDKLKKMIQWGAVALILSLLIHFLGICPIVKRIWTPTWVLFSGAMCCFLMALFYYLVEIRALPTSWLFLKVLGMNSIAAYVCAHTLDSYFSKSLSIHLGPNFQNILGNSYAPLLQGAAVLLLEWLFLYWLYKKKIFIKI